VGLDSSDAFALSKCSQVSRGAEQFGLYARLHLSVFPFYSPYGILLSQPLQIKLQTDSRKN
jgi:hypothetical protein